MVYNSDNSKQIKVEVQELPAEPILASLEVHNVSAKATPIKDRLSKDLKQTGKEEAETTEEPEAAEDTSLFDLCSQLETDITVISGYRLMLQRLAEEYDCDNMGKSSADNDRIIELYSLARALDSIEKILADDCKKIYKKAFSV